MQIHICIAIISISTTHAEFGDFFESFPDHEIEIDDSEIDPKIFFNLKNIDIRKPETYGIFMEPKFKFVPEYNDKFANNPFLDFSTQQDDDEKYLTPSDDVKPVVERPMERYAEDAPAEAVSFEHRHTSNGVLSSVTRHGKSGKSGKSKKYLAPKVANLESFSYQGKKFPYKLH